MAMDMAAGSSPRHATSAVIMMGQSHSNDESSAADMTSHFGSGKS
jgi:hypothetical protein